MKVLEYLGGDPSFQAHLFRCLSVGLEEELKVTRTRTNVVGTRYRAYLKARSEGRPVVYFSAFGRVVADELFIFRFGNMVRANRAAVFLKAEQKKVLVRLVRTYVRCRDRQVPFPLVHQLLLAPNIFARASAML